MKHTARDKILEAAESLMLSKGYPATTVDEICELAGVSKGSFYHFFATKEELGLAVLEAFHQRNGQIVAKGAHQSDDPVRRALALVDHLLASSGEMWGRGCLLGTFALDIADTNPAIGKLVSEKFMEVAQNLAGGMAPISADGGHPEAPTADEMAEQFIVVVEGALVLARAHQDWSYVERALDRFRQDVHQAIGVTA